MSLRPTLAKRPLWGSNITDARLASVDQEGQVRRALLNEVSVREGVAVCEHLGVAVQLAGVMLGDDHQTQQLFFEQEGNKLKLPVPADQPSVIGFLMNCAGPSAVASVVRIGHYPGLPIRTTKWPYGVSQMSPKDIVEVLASIDPNETAEGQLLERAGLYDQLGFKREQSCGIFSRAHRATVDSDTWTEDPLVTIAQGVFQFMTYRLEESKPWPSTEGDDQDSSVFWSQGGYERRVRIAENQVVGLQAAFEVYPVPMA